MRKNVLTIFFSCFFLLQVSVAVAQEQKPFWNEIQQFKKEDSLQATPKNAILFVGSSSFRLWKDIHQAFPKQTIINRGFGGSSLPHVIEYADEIIFPYQPKQIVIYCGENDIAGADTVTGKLVFDRFKQLFDLIRNRLPGIPVVYVAMKPSPSRWHVKEKMKQGNRLIKKFLQKKKNTAFVDVWKPMLNKNGEPNEALFLDDKLHMNAKGYCIWQKLIEPKLATIKSPWKG